MSDEVLLEIHNKAMIRYLGKALKQTVPQCAKKAREMWQPPVPEMKSFMRAMQEHTELILPPMYGLTVAVPLHVEDAPSLFSTLRAVEERDWVIEMSSDPKSIVFMIGSISGMAFLSASAVIGVPILGIGSLGFMALQNHVGTTLRHEIWKDIVAQIACAILVCEKLFWLGIKEIRSKEIVARALFEVLKQSKEIARFLGKVKDDASFQETVSNLVLAIRPNLGIVAE